MNFTTQIPIPKSNRPIDYNSRVVSLGSCFAENISEKFDYFKFRSTTNPFGIIFNPISIEKLLKRSIDKTFFAESDIFFYNEVWHCFEAHSDMMHSDKEEFLKNLNDAVEALHHQIKEATHIILTYGTSWVYKKKEDDAVVANCHKVPQQQFSKELLSVQTIAASIQNIISLIQKVNPKCTILFTISPVRHLKDGFVENQRSKSHLITALHQILDTKSESIHYFPSYEIMMDELRDYRFYANDLLHPSGMAIDYIWERFSQAWISLETAPTMETVASIQKGLAHRAFQPDTEQHQKFVLQLQDKIDAVQKQHPHIRF